MATISRGDSGRCGATTRAGQPCQARPAAGSPYCAAHRDWAEPGLIDAVIADLAARQAQLAALLDRVVDEEDVALAARLFALHGQNASRLGRLLRDKQALGGPADSLLDCLEQALDQLSEELGVEL